MKFKRRKIAKRILEFYSVHFGVRPPYKVGGRAARRPRGGGGDLAPAQVLADGSYLHTALTCKKEMPADLNKYLGARCKLFVTPGILRELEKLGEPVRETLAFARSLPVVDSPAPPESSARECILAVLGAPAAAHARRGRGACALDAPAACFPASAAARRRRQHRALHGGHCGQGAGAQRASCAGHAAAVPEPRRVCHRAAAGRGEGDRESRAFP